jgi:hypothetical protein
LTTVSAIPSQAGAMALAYGEMVSDVLGQYGQDLAQAVTPEDKLAIATSLQYVGAAAASGTAIAALSGSYETRDEVAQVVDTLVAAYAEYLVQLDAASTASPDAIDKAFAPDSDTGSILRGVILNTQAVLIDRAFSLRVARSYVLSAPSDAMTETWLRYGDLSRLDFFCKTNEIGGSDFDEIPAGRRLVYYA